ncbi:hypothetical protein BC834DRAFT_1035892 [Gloeopeniophorella convolvens]|nr:hypothetical protein BC834DRAFT_1035892 [Gloeopeniophorella convolvens]
MSIPFVENPRAARHTSPSRDRSSRNRGPSSSTASSGSGKASSVPTMQTGDSYYGHEELAEISARFVAHLFASPERPDPIPDNKPSTASPPLLANFIAYALHRTRLPRPSNDMLPTLSSWLKNMNTLNALIDRLHELVSTAPAEHRRQLERQVASLRVASKKQLERYIAFLSLSKDYADKYLLDISEEIQQQSSFLEALEKRLDMAKSLRRQIVDLRKSYETGTMDEIEKLRESVLSRPLPEDSDLFKELDLVLKEIRQCYNDMDKFWVEEIGRVTESLKTRRIDPEDANRWRAFRDSLQRTINCWKTGSDSGTTSSRNSRTGVLSPSRDDVGSLAYSLSDVILAARETLQGVRLGVTATAELLKPAHTSIVLQAEHSLGENGNSVFAFLKSCMRYGELVINVCTSFLSYPSFSRLKASAPELKAHSAHLKSEMAEVVEFSVTRTRGLRTYNSVETKALSVLRKLDKKFGTLLSLTSTWIADIDGCLVPSNCTVKLLQDTSLAWVKRRDAIREVLASLEKSSMP